MIYLVVSSKGSYDDYISFNEKAFTSKEKAEAYAKKLDKEHCSKPDFITDTFKKDYFECEDELPDWPDYSDLTMEEYKDYQKKYLDIDIQQICKLMSKRGYNLTPEMCYQFERYLSAELDEWHACKVEELELCE